MSAPIVQAQMLIRKPVTEVFNAFVDPAATTQFWFSKSSGKLEAGKRVRWDWEMYGVSDEIDVKAIAPDQRIVFQYTTSSTSLQKKLGVA